MADANSVTPGLAVLTGAGWDVIEPSEGGNYGSVGVLTAAQTRATQALVSGAGILWANRPTAATAGVGALQWFSDIGGGTLWRSDGTNWRPLNGRAIIGRQHGTIAVPVASLALGGAGVMTLSNALLIPAGMAIAGSSSIGARATFIHRGVAGVVGARCFVGPTPGSVTGGIAAKSLTLAASDTSACAITTSIDIRTLTTQTANLFGGENSVFATSSNFGDLAIDFSVAQTVMFGVFAGTAGTNPDTLDLVSYEVIFNA